MSDTADVAAVLVHVPRGLCLACIAADTRLPRDRVITIIRGLERTLRIVPSQRKCSRCRSPTEVFALT